MLLGGCAPGNTTAPQSSPSHQLPQAITPYATRTLSIPQTPTIPPLPTQTPPPLPTPTPYLYTVVANDTLIGIASYFGVSLDELMVANPNVNPNALSIGTQLIIPLDFDEGDQDQSSAGAEVLAMQTSAVVCYSVRSGGLWCYWLIGNQYDRPVENISGIINLYNNRNELAASQAAVPLLNVLSPGASFPLIAYFPPPLPQWSQAQGQLTGAIYANQYESRYLTTSIEQLTQTPVDAVGIQEQGMLVQGVLRYTLVNSESPAAPGYAWVVAVAYDADGIVAGVRRWEAADIPAGEVLGFNFEIYSLGKPIDRVELLAEVPAPTP